MRIYHNLIVSVFLIVMLLVPKKIFAQVIGVYEKEKLVMERQRLENRSRQIFDVLKRFLPQGQRQSFEQTTISYPTLSSDGTFLNFFAISSRNEIILPIHSLLILEDICTVYAWLHFHGYSHETINEYASILNYQQNSVFSEGKFEPLKALGIPTGALSNNEVNEMSLRFRNSSYAFVIAHEMAHINYAHKGNASVSAERSQTDESNADKFAIELLLKDNEIPMGALLFFQMTAFIASPNKFDYPSEAAWKSVIANATHPVSSKRVLNLSEILEGNADRYQGKQQFALDMAQKLKIISSEMNDADWHKYFRNIGYSGSLDYIKPRK